VHELVFGWQAARPAAQAVSGDSGSVDLRACFAAGQAPLLASAADALQLWMLSRLRVTAPLWRSLTSRYAVRVQAASALLNAGGGAAGRNALVSVPVVIARGRVFVVLGGSKFPAASLGCDDLSCLHEWLVGMLAQLAAATAAHPLAALTPALPFLLTTSDFAVAPRDVFLQPVPVFGAHSEVPGKCGAEGGVPVRVHGTLPCLVVHCGGSAVTWAEGLTRTSPKRETQPPPRRGEVVKPAHFFGAA
jgi:hypothetical protein